VPRRQGACRYSVLMRTYDSSSSSEHESLHASYHLARHRISQSDILFIPASGDQSHLWMLLTPHFNPAGNFALPSMVVVDIEVFSDLVCVVGSRLRFSKRMESKKRSDSVCGLSDAILASEHWKMLYLCTRKPIREERTTSSPSRGDRIISITTHRRTALTSANLWRASSAG
jgi:hypothetical protein